QHKSPRRDDCEGQRPWACASENPGEEKAGCERSQNKRRFFSRQPLRQRLGLRAVEIFAATQRLKLKPAGQRNGRIASHTSLSAPSLSSKGQYSITIPI